MTSFANVAADTVVVALTIVTPFVVKFSMLLLCDVLSPWALPVDPDAKDAEDSQPATWKNAEANFIGIFLGCFAAMLFAVVNLTNMQPWSEVAFMYSIAMVGPFFICIFFWFCIWLVECIVLRAKHNRTSLWQRVDSTYETVKRAFLKL